MIQVDFLMVKLPSAYNVILNRLSLWKLKAIVSSYHLTIKFPTIHGVEKIRGNQTMTRHCFATKLQIDYQVKSQFELLIGLDA